MAHRVTVKPGVVRAVLKPALRVLLWAGGAFIALLIAAVLLVWQLAEGLCDNTLIAEYPSPGGAHRVIVFQRSCGATTGFSTQASLLDADEDQESGSGNLFIADTNHGAAPSGPGGGPDMSVVWKDDTSLVLLHHPDAHVSRQARRIDGIRISYGQKSQWSEAVANRHKDD